MKKLFKFIPLVLLLCLPVIGEAQTITAAGTITDSDSVNWSSAAVTITFYPAPAYPNPATYTIGGVPITSYGLTYTGMTNSNGTFSILGIPNTTLISPAGSSYKIQICPNASVQCTILPPLALTGQSLTSYINGLIQPIRFAAQGANTWGYADGEVSPTPVQGAFYFNVTSGVSRQWNGTIWQNFGGSGGTCTGCVITNPAANVNQQITQQGSTSTDSNTLLGIHWVNSFYYPSNNGIATLGSGSLCAFSSTGTSGCSIGVSPYYGNTENPNGWNFGKHPFGGNTNGPSNNPGTAVYDFRNGQFSVVAHDPYSLEPNSASAMSAVAYEDLSLGQQSGILQGGVPTAFTATMDVFNGGNNFQNYFSGIPEYSYGTFYYAIDSINENWSSGRLFNEQIITKQHGVGDSVDFWIQHYCDGGENTSEDEGCEGMDMAISEDPSVATGTVSSGGGVTGPTTLVMNFTTGGGTQGQDRLWIDTSRISFSGTHWTGGNGALNNYPSSVADSTQTYPVSTMVSICYAGSDNGAGGAAGCPASGAPSGYVPGLSTSSTKFSPNASITVGIDTSTTTNLPAGFCNFSNAQSSNSANPCYIPASGAACLTSPEEYESVNYTYNSSTQQITLLNLRFPHANNGFTFAVGGLCGSVVEDRSNVYTGGGTSGTIDPVYPIEGSVDSHTIYYITQRTNEGYGLPLLGGSSDGGNYNGGSNIPGTAGQYGALCFSTGMTTFGLNGGTVNYNMNQPSGTQGVYSIYNGLAVTISNTSPSNSTYEGTWVQTWSSNNTFTYHPTTTPSGTMPSTGTVTFCNANYNIMPGARILNVLNSSGSVDGTINLMPNEMAGVVNGDTGRVPHYQQEVIQGIHVSVTKFQPEQYVGQQDNNFTWAGITTGPEPGVHINNNFNLSNYLGFGGTYALPFQSLILNGAWNDLIAAGVAPYGAVIDISSCLYSNCNYPAANFNLFKMPSLQNQGAVPGLGQDLINYDPYYQISQRSTGLYSGRFYDTQQGGNGNVVSTNSITTRETGYLIADQSVTSPSITTSSFTTTQMSGITVYPNVIGGAGSTVINYYIVGHALANPTEAVTIPQLFTVTTGPATLSPTNYVQICVPHQAGWAYFDILRTATNTSIVTNLSATVPNGSSQTPVQPGNYSCANDTGQATTLYVPSTTNTTGGINSAGPLVVPTAQVTSQTTPGIAQFDSLGNLTSTGSVYVAPVTFTIASFTIPANTCQGSATSGASNPATFSMPGLPASGTYLHVNPTGNPSALIGWGGSGGLNIWAWPSGTLGTANEIICNATAASITSSAITFSAAVN